METKDYLKILRDEIHSAVIATVDGQGHPAARVIDIMLADDNCLYFITAKGKAFYKQLMDDPYVAISGMCGGEGSMNKKAISIQGRARNIGSQKLLEVFRENPYMAQIYPSQESRMALEVFQVDEGQGEFFDLSAKPVFRDTFVLGDRTNGNRIPGGYRITDQCRGCGKCALTCPQNCIDISVRPAVIHQEHCLHCGNCLAVCSYGAVEKR